MTTTINQLMAAINTWSIIKPTHVDVYFERSAMEKYVNNTYHQTMIRVKPLAIVPNATQCSELIASYNKSDKEIYFSTSNSKYVIIRIAAERSGLPNGAKFYPKTYLPADELPEAEPDEEQPAEEEPAEEQPAEEEPAEEEPAEEEPEAKPEESAAKRHEAKIIERLLAERELCMKKLQFIDSVLDGAFVEVTTSK